MLMTNSETLAPSFAVVSPSCLLCSTAKLTTKMGPKYVNVFGGGVQDYPASLHDHVLPKSSDLGHINASALGLSPHSAYFFVANGVE